MYAFVPQIPAEFLEFVCNYGASNKLAALTILPLTTHSLLWAEPDVHILNDTFNLPLIPLGPNLPLQVTNPRPIYSLGVPQHCYT